MDLNLSTYALLSRALQAVKFGNSRNVIRRRREHQCSHAEPLVPLADWPGNWEREARMRFAHFRCPGGGTECYAVHDELLDWIESHAPWSADRLAPYRSFVFPDEYVFPTTLFEIGNRTRYGLLSHAQWAEAFTDLEDELWEYVQVNSDGDYAQSEAG